jgi:hypothetical protein
MNLGIEELLKTIKHFSLKYDLSQTNVDLSSYTVNRSPKEREGYF